MKLSTAPIFTTSRMTLRRWSKRLLLAFAIIVLFTSTLIYLFYHSQLKPNEANEWSFSVKLAGVSVPLSVSKTLLLASSPKFGPWINGLKRNTTKGQLKAQWDHTSNDLIISCSECSDNIESLGTDRLTIDYIELRIHQYEDNKLAGHLILGRNYPIDFEWNGVISPTQLKMEVAGQQLQIDSIYRTLAPDLKELTNARINGSLTVQANITLPELDLNLKKIEPRGFTVTGLGTEEHIDSAPKCGPKSNLPMNSWLVQAVIAAEDQRFETHPGYDLIELMNAHLANAEQGGIVRGGSTITQQTAKMLYTSPNKTLARKMRELLYAVEMEQTLGKARILQLYLDNAPWGIYESGQIVCGIESAAHHYFQIPPEQLQPAQAVWLAAMLHSPVREARRWEETGRINLNRAIWVAGYVRGAKNSNPKARQRVINELKRNPSLGIPPKKL